MGSPAIFNGKFTKLLTERGILNSNGSVNENDGYKNLIVNGNFENGLNGWQLGTITSFSAPPTPGAADLEMLLDTTDQINGKASLIVQNKATSPVWPADQGFFYHIGTVPGKGTSQFAGCVDSFRWQLPDSSQLSNADWSGVYPNSTFRHYIYSTTFGFYVDPQMYNPNGNLYGGYLPQPNSDQVNYLIGDGQFPAGDDLYYWIGAVNSTTGPITLKFDDICLGSPPSDIAFQQALTQVNALSSNIVLKSGDTMTGTLYFNPGNVIADNTSIYPAVYGAENSIRPVFGNNFYNSVNFATYAEEGTSTAASYSSSDVISRMPRVQYSSSSSAGSMCGPRLNSGEYATIGGGFRFETYFKITDAAVVSKARHFCGITVDQFATVPINATGNGNPLETSLTNFIAFGYDQEAAGNNFQIYHTAGMAGVGTTTKFPINITCTGLTSNSIYKITFVNPIGRQSVFWEVRDLYWGTRAYGEITTNLPMGPLFMQNIRSNGGTNLAVAMQAGGLYSYAGS